MRKFNECANLLAKIKTTCRNVKAKRVSMASSIVFNRIINLIVIDFEASDDSKNNPMKYTVRNAFVCFN